MTKSITVPGYIVSIAAGSPRQWGPKVGWDTVWATRAEAESCRDRASAQDGWEARVIPHDRRIAVADGPRQVDGVRRIWGWLDTHARAEDRREADLRAARNSGSADAMRPDLIVDVDPDGRRWEPVRGDNDLCAAIVRGAR